MCATWNDRQSDGQSNGCVAAIPTVGQEEGQTGCTLAKINFIAAFSFCRTPAFAMIYFCTLRMDVSNRGEWWNFGMCFEFYHFVQYR